MTFLPMGYMQKMMPIKWHVAKRTNNNKQPKRRQAEVGDRGGAYVYTYIYIYMCVQEFGKLMLGKHY